MKIHLFGKTLFSLNLDQHNLLQVLHGKYLLIVWMILFCTNGPDRDDDAETIQ